MDKLDFCHPIPWKGRLEVDSPSIPLAELLLEKMQIVKINEKDIIDTIMLLREHTIARDDADHINAEVVAKLCAGEWGLYRTTTMNLGKVRDYLPHLDLEDSDKQVVAGGSPSCLRPSTTIPRAPSGVCARASAIRSAGTTSSTRGRGRS